MEQQTQQNGGRLGPSAPHLATFRQDLLGWFANAKRDLPWRRTRDPYAVWVSEIMLQQTRVAAAIPYYERFLTRFPDFDALAQAPEQDLLTHWAGLGYYRRARNMQRAAQAMRIAGNFPVTYEGIRDLPGVGEYTAAAVASIALDLPHAVVDGNVFRVLSRIYADPTDIASAKARKHFTILANEVLDGHQPGAFNQAMMELGATVCLPRNPQCLLCPVQRHCGAFRSGSQADFPVKRSKQKQVRENRTVYWIQDGDRLLAWRRPYDASLMPGFWDLPEPSHLPNTTPGRVLGSFRHYITFHNYSFTVVQAEPPVDPSGCQWLSLQNLDKLPLSTVVRKAERVCSKFL